MSAICLRCARTEPNPLFQWSGEVVCRGCWKTVPQHLQRRHKTVKRSHRRIAKLDAQGYRTQEGEWLYLGKQFARLWATIKIEITGGGEGLAGLRGFFHEMGWL